MCLWPVPWVSTRGTRRVSGSRRSRHRVTPAHCVTRLTAAMAVTTNATTH